MVDMYLEDTPSKLRSLSAALQNDQMETAQHLGHALKGTSATIGAEKMQHLCQQIEAAAGKNDLLIVREAVTRLNSVYPDVLRSLANQELG
jgi:HPt (histidine-containing phosphotransfer) domain-containing protein